MITSGQYQELKDKYNTYHKAADQYRNKSGWLVVDAELASILPPSPTNDETSAIEVYEFVNDPPDKYFSYINEEKRIMTTWTGDVLGKVSFGYAYRDNMGAERVPITVNAINGLKYYGTYYKSSGDYCRIKRCKNQ